MKRVEMLLWAAILAAPIEGSAAALAQPPSRPAHVVPMEPDQLTLYPYGRPERRHQAYSYTQNPFNQPTPIYNTFMGAHY